MPEELYFAAAYHQNEEMMEQDWRRMKNYYPPEAIPYCRKIEKVCDRMEYDGSPMYAQIPDRVSIERIAQQIVEEENEKDEQPVMESRFLFPWVLTMLCDEMHVRRCRKDNRCRMFGNL